jgi:hypothetical protein
MGGVVLNILRFICICFIGLSTITMGIRSAAQATPTESLLVGAIDIHAHTLPDVTPRSVDAIQLARLAKESGMRAIVLKAHYWSTAPTAALVREVVPGIDVFGGIALNRSVGGMNSDAVEKMALTTGGYGRLVWMGSFDTEQQVRYDQEHDHKPMRPSVAVSRNGELLPETKEVIAMVAKYHLVLSTGHNSPDEILMIIREAQRQGVQHIVVTHAMMQPIHMPIARMQEAAKLGAYIEFAYNGLVGSHKEFEVSDYAKAIRAVGVEHCILVSDLGQTENPVHTKGLLLFYAGLQAQGFTTKEIHQMASTNPARLLGLQ